MHSLTVPKSKSKTLYFKYNDVEMHIHTTEENKRTKEINEHSHDKSHEKSHSTKNLMVILHPSLIFMNFCRVGSTFQMRLLNLFRTKNMLVKIKDIHITNTLTHTAREREKGGLAEKFEMLECKREQKQ